MGKTSHLLKLETETKKIWARYSEENFNGNLTDMIRTIVDDRISGQLVPKVDLDEELSLRIGGILAEVLERKKIIGLLAQN